MGGSGTQVLSLSFRPAAVTAGGKALSRIENLTREGYTLRPLAGGDFEVRVRHAGTNAIRITGGPLPSTPPKK